MIISIILIILIIIIVVVVICLLLSTLIRKFEPYNKALTGRDAAHCSWVFSVRTGQHRRISPMSSSTRPISRPRDAFDLLPHLSVAGYPSYTAVHRWQSGLPCCCCPYLEQSAPTCHFCTLQAYDCFQGSPQDFPFRAFLTMTFATTFVVPAQWQLSLFFGHLNSSFYLLSYLTYLVNKWANNDEWFEHLTDVVNKN